MPEGVWMQSKITKKAPHGYLFEGKINAKPYWIASGRIKKGFSGFWLVLITYF